MRRTKKRALITGSITVQNAALYSVVLGVCGFGVLAAFTNRIMVIIGLIGLVDYVLLYAFSKRKWTTSTLIGSISGATPIAAGYCAAAGTFDRHAAILFLIMTFWQMPHFYAIALFRAKDYEKAHLPVLPLIRGDDAAKKQLLLYCMLFLISVVCLSVFSQAGYIYLITMVWLSVWWIVRGIQTVNILNSEKWGLEMFKASLWTMIGLSVAVSFARILP